MSRLVHEGNTKVYFLTTLANKAAPTVAEVTAGKNLTPFITKDGINTPSSQNYADTSGIDETFDAQTVGSWGGQVSLKLFRDDAAETTSYDVLIYGAKGYLVISRFGVAAVGKKVEVYPVQCHEPVMSPSAANENQTYTVGFAVTAQPSMRSVMA